MSKLSCRGRAWITAVSALIFSVSGAARASEVLDIQQEVNATALTESALSSIAVLQAAVGAPSIPPLNVTGSFNDAGWTANISGTIAGQALNLNLAGLLSGSVGSTLTDTMSGTGTLGVFAVTVSNGSEVFHFDSPSGTYTSATFSQLTEYADPFWGWVAAGEGLVGGVIGGAAGLAAGSIATAGTGGLGLPAGIALTAGGALTGSTAALGGSAAVQSLTSAPAPPPPPTPPPPPANVPNNAALPIGGVPGMLTTAVTSNAMLIGGYGTIDMITSIDTSTNQISGSITAVPEPSTLTMAAVMTVIAVGLRRRIAA